jgi:hypothetical protein
MHLQLTMMIEHQERNANEGCIITQKITQTQEKMNAWILLLNNVCH